MPPHPQCVIETLYKENEELRNLFVIAAVAGQGPDLIYGPADNVGVLVMTETVMPLDEDLPRGFFPAVRPPGHRPSTESRRLIADQIGNHLMLVYNKDLVPEPARHIGRVHRARASPDQRHQRRRETPISMG